MALKKAAMTDGEYYLAESADELNRVFANLPTYYVIIEETREISVAFSGVGALLAAAVGKLRTRSLCRPSVCPSLLFRLQSTTVALCEIRRVVGAQSHRQVQGTSEVPCT